MASNRIEPGKGPPTPDAAAPAAGAAGATAKGGISSWIPLIANVVMMPALAYGLTTFYLVPKVEQSLTGAPSAAPAAHGESNDGHGAPSGATRVSAPLSGKVLVNVSGTQGTRYLIANITLVGTNPELKTLTEKHDPQLRDVASSALASKTIGDLEKPGARNLIRTELIAAFNQVLGPGLVQEIYLTDFAIQ